MSVATQYPASAMNNPPTSRIRPPQIQRSDFESKQASNRFDNHDDFYAFLDNNRGAGGNSNSNSNNANAGLALQSALPPAHTQQQQQRGTSGDHSSRPPVSNTYNSQRNTSSTSRSRPPSYTGSRSEEILIERSDNNNYKVQRQNGGAGRRGSAQASGGGGRPTTSSGGPSNTSTTAQVGGGGAGNISPTRHDAPGGARPMSSSGSPQDAAAYGAAIQRLKTPSVMSAVLQPLDTKVREYDALAAREQDEMKRLDDEIRGLQERRAAAEARFLDAKGRHDDYQRQYQDVERALRGEALLPRVGVEDFAAVGHDLGTVGGGGLSHAHTQTTGQLQHQHNMHGGLQRPVSFALHHDADEYSDEDDMPVQRRVQSQQSFGKTSQKMGMKERFRNSIFGSR